MKKRRKCYYFNVYSPEFKGSKVTCIVDSENHMIVTAGEGLGFLQGKSLAKALTMTLGWRYVDVVEIVPFYAS